MQLGDIDWSGIATNLVKGVAAYQQNRDAIKLQMAQLQAQQLMQARAAMPPSAYPPAPAQGVPSSGTPGFFAPQPQPYRGGASSLPSWVLPVGLGAVALLAVVSLRR